MSATPSTAARAALALTGVGFTYPDGTRALDEIELEVRAGELLSLVGPNGSGKSTLLKLAAGLLTPSEGTVHVVGEPLAALGIRARARRIASVPQRLEALSEGSVEGFVLGGRYAHSGFLGRALGGVGREDRRRVEAALARTDALAWRDRPFAALSGGERQRVLVARALAQDAACLLFDEPTAMLDPGHQVQVFESIASLCAEGRTALVATHDLTLAGRYSDRLCVLREGRMAALGTPDEVLRPEVLHPIYGPGLRVERDGERRLAYPWPPEERP